MQNEVCLIIEVDADDARPDKEQALLEIKPEQILRHRILTKTNTSFPTCRFDKVAYATKEQRQDKAPLACRWKMRAEYKDPSQRRAGRPQGQTFEHLSEHDSTHAGIKSRNLGADAGRSSKWRGETILGGSAIDVAKPDPEDGDDYEPVRTQKYSFADISAGAGGASRGAELAGLKVVLATEPCVHACHSYRTNFPDVQLYQMDANELAEKGDRFDVDILHMSLAALSAAGDEDATEELCTKTLAKFHPRITVVEQQSSMTSEQKVPLLNAIIVAFTKAGYSARWKIIQMTEYGLPQMRKRLIIIGAGPGEALPPWPPTTHSSDPHRGEDQRALVTERDAIRSLNPQLHSLHEPGTLRTVKRSARDAAADQQPINSPISADGSPHAHPGGRREFTARELACLQGFPTYHEFEGAYVKRQIGTAFPPSVAMAFYQHVRQHLEEMDSTVRAAGSLGSFDRLRGASCCSSSGASARRFTEEGDDVDEEVPTAGSGPDTCTFYATGPSRREGGPTSPASRQPVVESTRMPSPSPQRTMPPEALPQRTAGPQPSSPAAHSTPSPAVQQCQLPTPSSSMGGSLLSAKATLHQRRDRAVFEEEETEDGGGGGGPESLPTPSKKRPRNSRMST
jgi:DNA (cytosine-5)-methyltransferase 1